jgi:hypothetical protein
MPEHFVGAELVHETVADLLASWSVNMTSPPGAISILSAGCGMDPDPWTAQHGQLGSTQFWLTSSFFTSDVPAVASVGSTATAAPISPARAKSKSVRGLIVNPPFSCWMSI